MKLLGVLLLAIAPFALANPIAEPEAEALASADGPPPLLGADAEASLVKRESCNVSGKGDRRNGAGTCQNTDYWSCAYTSVPGFCPGPADYQCCRVIYCSGQYSAYTCRNTYKGCGSGGSWKTGFCPGGSDIKCCAY